MSSQKHIYAMLQQTKPFPHKEQGFILYVAIIFMIVLIVLVSFMVRSTSMGERGVAIEQDIFYARMNAQLALRDAEADILGLDYQGYVCTDSKAKCQSRGVGERPQDKDEVDTFWAAKLHTQGGKGDALGGIDGYDEAKGESTNLALFGMYYKENTEKCGVNVWDAADWQDGRNPKKYCKEVQPDKKLPTVPYGYFTGAKFTGSDDLKPRYLIEVFQGKDLELDDKEQTVFRITAVGFGRTAGEGGKKTIVALQEVYIP